MNWIDGTVFSDALENISADILSVLLSDRSTGKNIIWATSDYAFMGKQFGRTAPIRIELLTEADGFAIQPRTAKPLESQTSRVHGMGEVFTPAWLCNRQNNLVDEAWFGRQGVFNEESGRTWTRTKEPVQFSGAPGRGWKDYVCARRLEISCGEAPYLASRYDAAAGSAIAVGDRIGLLDRKLRIVGENAFSTEEWSEWGLHALQSVYGYEFQGDSLLIARKNVFIDFLEHFWDRFKTAPDSATLRKAAEIVSWNLWQMDGTKGVVPFSCGRRKRKKIELQLFGTAKEQEIQCPGCRDGGFKNHDGIYCMIMDWQKGQAERFASSVKEAAA